MLNGGLKYGFDMSKLFDFFAGLTLILVITGGIVHRFDHLYLDLASVDTFAIVALVVLAFSWKKIEKNSKVFSGLDLTLNHPNAKNHARAFYWVSFGVLFLAHVAKHWSLKTDGYDVSFVHQAMFNPFSETFFPADISPTHSALGGHLLFSLIPLSLITQFARWDELLFLIQTLSVAVPLYWYLFKGPANLTKQGMIWALVMLALSAKSLRNAIVFDFREDAFAFLGISVALLSLIRGKIIPYFIGLIFALLSKENIPFILFFITIPLIFSTLVPLNKKTRIMVGIGSLMITATYAIIAFKFLLPYYNPNPEQSSPILLRFSQFGKTPSQIVLNIITIPKNWLLVMANLLNKNVVIYLVMMLIPRFPIFLSKDAFLFAIPGIVGMGLNIITGYSNQTAMIFHYDLAPLAFILFAMVIGLNRAFTDGFLKESIAHHKVRLVGLLFLGLSFSDKWPVFHLTFNLPTSETIEARLALLKLNRTVPVLTNAHLSAQLNQHQKMIVLEKICDETSISKVGNFEGYWITDEKERRNTGCPEPKMNAIFKNTEVAIYHYSIQPNSDKLNP